MGIYKYIGNAWKRPKESLKHLWKQRLIDWRREGSTVKLEFPTRIDRARALGYKAKQGVFVVRQRVLRGGHVRKRPIGRKQKNKRSRLDLRKNYQLIAEERAIRNYPNCEVLNSYWVGQDGKQYWFEIIVVDRSHPAIRSDNNLNWITDKQHIRRVFRGLTSAGKKVRGLRYKGKGVEKARPSRKANDRLL